MNEAANGVRVEPLDAVQRLPWRNRVSLVLLMLLTALNAFNDNLMKMLLVGLAPQVTSGTLGRDIGLWLGAFLLLPYVLMAPLAGFLSDRFAKHQVLRVMLVMQVVVLMLFAVVFEFLRGELGVVAGLGLFWLIALQSTIFSPAKMGVLKEWAGSRRLGVISGWLQMMTMAGILGGLSLGGPWFDHLLKQGGDPWKAALEPTLVLCGVALAAMVAGGFLAPSPTHGGRPFQWRVMVSHFGAMRDALKQGGMRAAFVGGAFYWFVASMAAAMFVDLGLEAHPEQGQAGAASAASRMTLMVGVGTAVGSLLAAAICRRGVQLGAVPLGALGMALALAAAALGRPGTGGFDGWLMMLGLCSAVYQVPIQAWIQDRAVPEERGRVLASMNLLNSLAGVGAVVVLGVLKNALGWGALLSFGLLGGLMLLVTIASLRRLPQEVIRLVGRALIRVMYGVRCEHEARLPKQGGVLLLPNHTSYVDSLVLSTAIERPIRFVVWERYYRVRSLQGFLRVFGAVPISATRAKEAVRRVVEALRAGELVCLFPEGQLTRHGMVNELRRGFELMARQAGVPVVPAYQAGLWGSLFSFERGKAFKKWPLRWLRPVRVLIGEPMPARAATAEVVRDCLLALESEAFLARPVWDSLRGNHGEAAVVANAERLRMVVWHDEKESVWGVDPAAGMVSATLRCYARERRDVKLFEDQLDGGTCPVVAVGTAAALAAARRQAGDGVLDRVLRVVCVRTLGETVEANPWPGAEVFSLWVDRATEAWVAMEVPHPRLPVNHFGEQTGHKESALGRLLPGWRVGHADGALELSGFHPGWKGTIHLPGLVLDADGFLVVASPGQGGRLHEGVDA